MTELHCIFTILGTDVPVPLPTTTTTQPECSLSEETIIIIVSVVAGSVLAIALFILFALIIRMCWRAYLTKDLLERVAKCTDPEVRKRLLDILEHRMKADSGSENGAAEEGEEDTTSEPAEDAIAGHYNMDESDESNYPRSSPNCDDSTAVNSVTEQEMKPQSLGANTGHTRVVIDGVPDLDTDEVQCKPRPPTCDSATEPCQTDGGSDDDAEGTEDIPIQMVTSL